MKSVELISFVPLLKNQFLASMRILAAVLIFLSCFSGIYAQSGTTAQPAATDTLVPHPDNTAEDNIPTVTLSDDDLKETGTQPVASVLNASFDVYLSAATYNFSIVRFKLRGLDEENFVTLMNDAPMQDLA